VATDAEIREWARANDREVPARGPLSPAMRAAYYEAEGGDPADEDFAADMAAATSAASGPPGDARPRSIPSARRRPGWLRKGGKKKTGRARKARPRVPVDDLIATAWRGLAGFARPIPATSRLLKIQAPVAGMVLEDMVRDTAIDRMLQPFARVQGAGEALFALAGPPLLITALQLQPDSMPFVMPMLRESLLAWVRVAGPKMTAALKREQEFEEEFGETVDDLIAFLLEPLTVHDGETEAQAEEAGVTRHQQAMARDTAEPEPAAA
jgi:hypothetical protein